MFSRKKMFNRKNQIQNIDAYVEERLSEYLDGTLPDQEREIVQAHLATSERARASLEALRYTVNLLKQTPAPALPRQFTLPVTSRAPVQSAPGWLVWGLRGVGVAATAAFVVLLVATLLRPASSDTAARAPAAAVAPSVVVAFNATSVPSAEIQQSSVASEANPSPFMVTEQPSIPSAPPVPVTLTPDLVQKSQAPQQDSDAVAPTPVPPQPTKAPPTAIPQPTIAPVAANASGVTASAPELSAPTATSDIFTTRIAIALEGEIIKLTQLKVREGPGTQYPAIGSVRLGERVMVTGRSLDDAWLKIDFPKNRKTSEGWISSAYVRLNGTIGTLPVAEIEPELPTLTPTPTETLGPAPGVPTSDEPVSTPPPTEGAVVTEVPPVTAEPLETPEIQETPTTQAPEEVATETPVPPTEPGRGGTEPTPAE